MPKPFKKRPSFGARLLVRSHVRKMWHALYSELKDWNNSIYELIIFNYSLNYIYIANRLKAAKLVLVSIIYSEDYMT